MAVLLRPLRGVLLAQTAPRVRAPGQLQTNLLFHRGRALPRQLLRRAGRQRPVHREGDRGVEAAQHETVRGNVRLAGQGDAAGLVVGQLAHGLEGAGPGRREVVHKQLEVELAGVGGAEPHASGEVRLHLGAQRDDSDLGDVDGAGELHQVQVDVLDLAHTLAVMAEGVKEEELRVDHVHHCVWWIRAGDGGAQGSQCPRSSLVPGPGVWLLVL